VPAPRKYDQETRDRAVRDLEMALAAARAQGEMFALNLLGMALSWAVDVGVEGSARKRPTHPRESV
jgi:hypothetical protein